MNLSLDDIAGDPFQRLLTALGRFQRQCARGEEVAPDWIDEAEEHLAEAEEIAQSQRWNAVAATLSDTRHILDSCASVGKSELALPILIDAYEILCLMVGDLIVGNVRSGTRRKWQQRYEKARSQLAEEGINLQSPAEIESDDLPPPTFLSRWVRWLFKI